MASLSDEPYWGEEKLVIGIDIGTTASAVSFTHLQHGSIPIVRTVNSWPASPLEAKIPSLVLFNSSGEPVAVGAECLTSGMKLKTSMKGFHLAKWWKLHLHPRQMQFDSTATLSSSLANITLGSSLTRGTIPSIIPDFEVPSLPPNVTIDKVYRVFLTYLFEHAKAWWIERKGGDTALWDRLCDWAEIIMGIPDGWNESQQAILQRALVAAGACSAEGAELRLTFIREAEAAIHYALSSPETCAWLKPGAIFTLADLGGSTVDICMYRCIQVSPTLQLKEIKLSDCVQAGGVYVDRAAHTLVKAKLGGSSFFDPDTIASIVALFEEKTKRKFSGEDETYYIKFAPTSASDQQHGVVKGRLVLSKLEVESTFVFCVNEILSAVKQQVRMGSDQSSHIIIAGGFSESLYVQSRLRAFFQPSGFKIVTSGEQSKLAVAEGAIYSHLSSLVCARAARSCFGAQVLARHNRNSYSHLGRPHFIHLNGLAYVDGAWSTIVPKGSVLRTSAAFSQTYEQMVSNARALANFTADVLVYEGDDANPQWCRDVNDKLLPGFVRRATVSADLSCYVNSLKPLRKGSTVQLGSPEDVMYGKAYYKLNFSIRLFVAATTLKAKVLWEENGRTCEGPATLIFAELNDRAGGATQVARRRPADIVAQRA